MLHKEIPFLRIIIPLCAGIVSTRYTEPDLTFLFATAILAVFAILLTLLFKGSQTNTLYGIILTAALVLCGHLLYSFEKSRLTTLDQKMSSIVCTVSDFPEERENSFRVKVRLTGIYENEEIKTVTGSMMIYLEKDSSSYGFLPGDIIEISCVPAEITNRGNPYEFDYKFYMENQGIRYMAFPGKNDITGHIVPGKRNVVHNALIIRDKIIEMYRNRGITGRNLALVAAMTVGEKSMLEQEQKEIFINAGVMHIMAVSGLHAVVLSLFVFNILFFMKRRFNILRILIAIIFLWAFAFVTGLTPSVMRATLMFSFIQAGNIMKRAPNSINSVLASAFVLILIRPSVIFDAGFLLSYSAVLFIISFYRNLYAKLQFNNWLADKIWQSVVVTLVAQAGTFSLTVMLFNRFPAYFLLTNVIIVPLSSLIIITGCILPLLYPVVFLSGLLGTTLNYMTRFTEFLTEKAASLPGSSIGGIGMTAFECILLTIIIAVLCYTLINNQLRLLKYLLSLVIIIAIAGTFRDISVRRSNELIVYNSPGATVVGIRTGKILNLYSTGEDIPPAVLRHSSTLGLRIENKDPSKGTSCIEVAGKKILITTSAGRSRLSSLTPDIVILAGSRPFIEDCPGGLRFQGMVITSSEVAYRFRIPGDFFSCPDKPAFEVRKAGAFRMSL